MPHPEPALSDRAAVEVFHLALLRTLLSAPAEKAHLTVKGGCNLRFFFGSPRYSEDLDLDVDVIARHTLKRNVDKALSGTVLARQLAAAGLSVADSSAPKQTDTVQRWKVQLRTARGAVLPTKVEISRRGAAGDAELHTVDRRLLDGYRLPTVQARHYLIGAALRQKVVALADREIAQARDVFDLDLLATRAGRDLPKLSGLASELAQARDRALSIAHGDYVAKVVAYLEPSEQPLYRSRDAWEAMQLHVADTLERMAR
ncbi:MAG: hypothetical protein A2138_05685 [Deltaproteobacteria bacterium RBG_16_71_12]|nr:MAG: hypothetical protein A2138_05685 [Deltaproteobacteria bacterium RBG_16_71_12]